MGKNVYVTAAGKYYAAEAPLVAADSLKPHVADRLLQVLTAIPQELSYLELQSELAASTILPAVQNAAEEVTLFAKHLVDAKAKIDAVIAAATAATSFTPGA